MVLFALIFLASSSGFSKILLAKQDMDFFGSFGFTAIHIAIFGLAHLLGAALLGFRKTRLWGAVLVAICFATSAFYLLAAKDMKQFFLTLMTLALLAWVMQKSLSFGHAKKS